MNKTFLFVLFLSSLLQSCIHQKENGYDVMFEEVKTNVDASLRGLHVVDENVVWASGSRGTVLLTKDGGENWKVNEVQGAEKNDFRSIHAWDEKKAMVFGVAGPEFGYFTNNGGETWEVVFQDSTKGLFFNSLKFTDEKNGLAVSDPLDGKFFIIRTEDGGVSWERITNIPDVKNGEANFAASNTCIEFLPSGKAWIASGGLAARVFYSSDFGKSWKVAETPMIRGKASSGIFSISFKNDKDGVIVGGIYDEPEIASNIACFTNDGGKKWQPSETMPKEYRSCVQFNSTKNNEFFYAIGKTGSDYSIDGGLNWQHVNNKGFYTFRNVPGELEGFAAGANGKIVKVSFEKK